MKKSKPILWLLGALVFVAYAADYGRYRCDACAVAMSPIDVRSFISVFVNPNVGMWQAKDTVSICNGSTCTQYITANQGTVWSVMNKYPDLRIDYKGAGEPVSDAGGFGPPIAGYSPDSLPVSPSESTGYVEIGGLQPGLKPCSGEQQNGYDGSCL